MLDADELPTPELVEALPDLMTSRGAYLHRKNTIAGIDFTTDTHYRLFPVDNVAMGTTLHSRHHPLSPEGTVQPHFIAIDHDKTLFEQLKDDVSYESLGQEHHPILDRARNTGLAFSLLDTLPRDQRERLVLG